jgi:hypothetical protein
LFAFLEAEKRVDSYTYVVFEVGPIILASIETTGDTFSKNNSRKVCPCSSQGPHIL